MDPAALPGGADEHGGDGLLEAQVVVGDDEGHAFEASRPKALEERRPEGAVLAVAHLHAQHFSVSGGGDARGDHHGARDDSAAQAALDVGGIGEDIGELDVVQRSVAERLELGVQAGTDAGDLALGDPGLHAEGLDQVVDLACADAVHVGLHHHREQRAVDAAAPFEQAREERAGPQLGHGQVHVAGRRGEQP